MLRKLFNKLLRLITGWSRTYQHRLSSHQKPFVEHLRSSHVHLYYRAELNEILLSIYIIIERAVRDQADSLTLTPNAFIWSRNGIPIGHFDTAVSRAWSTSYEHELKKLLRRDKVVRKHLQRIQMTPEAQVYRILIDSSQKHSAT